LQTDGAKPMKAGYGKAGKQKTLSNFPTATTTTNYNYLWDTDSEGKVSVPIACVPIQGVIPFWVRALDSMCANDTRSVACLLSGPAPQQIIRLFALAEELARAEVS
jgi:hypothetical protein